VDGPVFRRPSELDLLVCTQCGTPQQSPGSTVCEQCGVDLPYALGSSPDPRTSPDIARRPKHNPGPEVLLVQRTRAALLMLGSIVSRTVAQMRQARMRPRPHVAKAPQNSVRRVRRSLRPRVSVVQLARTTILAVGLIVFRTAAQMVLITALGLGVCFIPDVNAHVPQTKEFSATAASLVELIAREWGIKLFPGRTEAMQSQPSTTRSLPQQRPAQFVATQAVLVSSTPDGAIIRLGGRAVGKTPLTLRIAPGTVTITLSRPGYAPVSRTLTVKLGKAASVQVTLTAAPEQSTGTPTPQMPTPSGKDPTQDPTERDNAPPGGGTKPSD
jgi:hypothetical protein